MCGRSVITTPHDATAALFDATLANMMPEVPNYNVCPTVQVPMVRSGETGRMLESARWGFLPAWYRQVNDGPLIINARAETIAEKPAFRDACVTRRCILPVSGFYEWHRPEGGEKQPWYISRADGAVMAFAGIWQDWQDKAAPNSERLRSAAIVTCEAQGQMAEIHNRVPVILAPENWGKWLGEEGHGAARLMVPPASDDLSFRAVSRAVNSNRATGPDLIEEIEL